jgi:DNA-binding transcriptional ArsR family regulator
MAHKILTPGLLEFVAARLKALGDPARLRILDGLRRGPRTVSQLARETRLRQATVSKHLAILRSLGLVNRRRERAFVYFAVADTRLHSLCDLMCDQPLR